MKKLIPAILVLALPLASPAHAAGDCTEAERLAHPVGCGVRTTHSVVHRDLPAAERERVRTVLLKGDPGESVVGPPGPKGDKGDPGESIVGPPGPAGKDGRDASADAGAMALAVASVPEIDAPFSLGLGAATAAGVPALALGMDFRHEDWRLRVAGTRTRDETGFSAGLSIALPLR